MLQKVSKPWDGVCVCLILATGDSLFTTSWSVCEWARACVCLAAFVGPAVALSASLGGSSFVFVFVSPSHTWNLSDVQ